METEKNLRLTRQRSIILEELRAMGRHPTACELYDAVRGRLPRISLATVYRNLEFLSEKGLIRKITTAGRRKRFDMDPCRALPRAVHPLRGDNGRAHITGNRFDAQG